MLSRIDKPEATIRGLSGFGIAKKSRPDRRSLTDICQQCLPSTRSIPGDAVRRSQPSSKNTSPCLIRKTLLKNLLPVPVPAVSARQDMDRHTSPSRGTPAPYGHACASCAQSKCKCVIRRAGGPCERSAIRPKSPNCRKQRLT
jgi:hypothetical protein